MKKNILFLHNSLDIGGAEQLRYALLKNLDRNKYNIRWLCCIGKRGHFVEIRLKNWVILWMSYKEEIIVNLLIKGNGFVDTLKIWGILSPDKKYSSKRINEACEKALSIHSYNYRTILGLLELGKKPFEKENVEIKSRGGSPKFVRPIKEYQQLLN